MKQWSDGSLWKWKEWESFFFSRGKDVQDRGKEQWGLSFLTSLIFSWTNGRHASVQVTNREVLSRFLASDRLYILERGNDINPAMNKFFKSNTQ